MRLSVRHGVIRVHRWIGLTVGLLAIFLAVTGAWIVFRPELEPLVYPELMFVPFCVKPLSIDTLAADARAFHPGARLQYLYVYGSPTASTMARFSDADQVYLDGCDGEVLGDQPRYGGLYGTAEGLHKLRFLKSKAAMPIIGTTALVLAVALVLGGVFAWWPRSKRGWKKAITLDRGLRGRLFAVRLHTIVGVYAGAIVFIIAVTAVPLSLDWAKATLFATTRTTDMTDESPPREPKLGPSAPTISMQRAWNEARGLVPGPLLWASLSYPADGEAIEIGIVRKDAPHWDARNYVYIDSRSGSIIAFRPYSTLNLGSKLYYWALAIHTGHVGGVFGQLLMVLGMLSVPVLGYTGIESFLRKKLRRL